VYRETLDQFTRTSLSLAPKYAAGLFETVCSVAAVKLRKTNTRLEYCKTPPLSLNINVTDQHQTLQYT
jgi:hypothetical protein